MHSGMVSAWSTSWLESKSMDFGFQQAGDEVAGDPSLVTRHTSIARRPVRQSMLADAVLQPVAVHLQDAHEEIARVARVDDVLRLVEAGELPRRGVAVHLRD